MFHTRLSILLSLFVLILLNAANPGSADSLSQFAATVRLDRAPSATTIIIDDKMLEKLRGHILIYFILQCKFQGN